jgi:hypothetical protein
MDPRLCGQSPDVEKGRAYPWQLAKLQSSKSSDTITTRDQRYPKATAVTLEIPVLSIVSSIIGAKVSANPLGVSVNPNRRTLTVEP